MPYAQTPDGTTHLCDAAHHRTLCDRLVCEDSKVFHQPGGRVLEPVDCPACSKAFNDLMETPYRNRTRI